MRTLIVVGLALVACKDPAPPAPSTLAPPPSPSTVGAPGSQNLAPLAGVMARLEHEAAQRPHVAITADAVFDALDRRGIEVGSRKQVLATVAQAQYCALGVTAHSIAIAVCEYASADAARAGKQLLDTRYAKLVPDALRAVHGTTLITVANASHHRDVRDRVIETFQSL